MVEPFLIVGITPLEKASLKMDKSSILAIGLSVSRKVGGVSYEATSPLLFIVFMAAVTKGDVLW